MEFIHILKRHFHLNTVRAPFKIDRIVESLFLLIQITDKPEDSVRLMIFDVLRLIQPFIVENDLKHVQIIGDFYHMNIEEDNLAQALHDNRDLLGHVHIADNHRYQPGSGTLDFHALFEQLRADNYQGYVVYEGRIRAEDPAQAYRDSLAWLRTC